MEVSRTGQGDANQGLHIMPLSRDELNKLANDLQALLNNIKDNEDFKMPFKRILALIEQPDPRPNAFRSELSGIFQQTQRAFNDIMLDGNSSPDLNKNFRNFLKLHNSFTQEKLSEEQTASMNPPQPPKHEATAIPAPAGPPHEQFSKKTTQTELRIGATNKVLFVPEGDLPKIVATALQNYQASRGKIGFGLWRSFTSTGAKEAEAAFQRLNNACKSERPAIARKIISETLARELTNDGDIKITNGSRIEWMLRSLKNSGAISFDTNRIPGTFSLDDLFSRETGPQLRNG